MIKKTLVPIGLLLAALAVAVFLVGNRRTLEPRQPETPPIVVRAVTVEPARVRLKVHAQGTVSPRIETELVPEVSGSVVWISPNLVSGGYFEAGETLLRIDQRDYDADVERSFATLERARADDELARFELGRAEDLFDRELISQADLETKQREARVAAAALRDAELVLDRAGRDRERTELKAPFAGLVRSEQVDLGQFVSRGTSLAQIYATDYLEVRLPLADRELAYLNIPLSHRGAFDPSSAPKVRLSADYAGTTQTWNARLVRTEAEIDPGTRMVYAIARVDADADADDGDGGGGDASGNGGDGDGDGGDSGGGRGAGIAPPVGLFVDAEINGIELDNVVVLPRSALRDGNHVLVIDTENRVHLRKVDVLRVYRDEVFISAGLRAQDRVSVSNLQTVVEGMRVQPLESDL